MASPEVKENCEVSDDNETFESTINTIATDINNSYLLMKQIKLNMKEITRIHKFELKMFKKIKRKKSNNLSGFNKPSEVPDSIKKLFKLDDTKLPRTHITKLIFEYINENKLRSEKDAKVIIPNKELQTLFGLEKGEQLSFYNIQTHLKKIYKMKNEKVSTDNV